MKVQDALKKMTWLKDQRMIGRFRCENPSENQDLSTLINQVILALGKPEPLAKNKQTQEDCEHPFAYVMSKCNGEINKCLKCGKQL